MATSPGRLSTRCLLRHFPSVPSTLATLSLTSLSPPVFPSLFPPRPPLTRSFPPCPSILHPSFPTTPFPLIRFPLVHASLSLSLPFSSLYPRASTITLLWSLNPRSSTSPSVPQALTLSLFLCLPLTLVPRPSTPDPRPLIRFYGSLSPLDFYTSSVSSLTPRPFTRSFLTSNYSSYQVHHCFVLDVYCWFLLVTSDYLSYGKTPLIEWRNPA